ncbi:MAG: hypothetical protein QNI87_12080 [Erythrobacter sp.]|uniref:hypothetical protein n=1 Tax=Erythrobacter sp. TaxID=1042 RepID=UPI00260F0C8F|nr:hypothetical protein [Erythrobacter sp.]MDJ0979255.1 hypothetical protein [Erythrobacter sp.]
MGLDKPRTASRLIKKHGQTATLLRAGPGGENAFGEPIPGVDTEYPCTILTATYAVDLKLITAGFIEIDDRRVFLSVEGLTIEPKTSDRIRIGGTEYNIGKITPLAPDGEVIFYELGVTNA